MKAQSGYFYQKLLLLVAVAFAVAFLLLAMKRYHAEQEVERILREFVRIASGNNDPGEMAGSDRLSLSHADQSVLYEWLHPSINEHDRVRRGYPKSNWNGNRVYVYLFQPEQAELEVTNAFVRIAWQRKDGKWMVDEVLYLYD